MRIIKSIVFIFCSVLSFSLSAQKYEQAIAKSRFLIQEHQKLTHIPAVQIAVMIDNEIVWSEAMGYADLENSIEASPNTKFRTASIAKPLTSIALGKMLQEGIIQLDDSVGKFFPDYPTFAKDITVRQLAGSISGIRHYNDSDPKYRTDNYERVADAIEIFKDDPLEFEPETKYGYSSYGWVLLSAIMEKARGVSFEKIMQQNWSSLGVENTLFDAPNMKAKEISKFYVNGSGTQRKLAPYENRSYMYAGGGYLSTAEDLVKIGNQFINYEYLSKSTVDTLTKSLHLKNGEDTFYGLGWDIGSNKIATKVWYHNGSLPTARTHWVLLPDENIVLAYLTNTGEHVFFNDLEAHTITNIFLDAKRASSASTLNNDTLSGVWQGKVTSLYGKSKKAKLELHLNEGQLVTGTINFKRSRKKEGYPVILKSSTQDSIHLIAVTPMFADFHLRIDGKDILEGEWQHEFVKKPNQDTNTFWKRRKASFKRIDD